MATLIVISLTAYIAIALLFKAASSHTRPDHLVMVALSSVALISAVMMIIRGEWGGTWLGALIAIVSGALFYFASIFRVRALATTPVSLVFAVTNLDLVVSGTLALLIPIFGQSLTIWQVLALITAASAILIGGHIRGVDHISADTFISLALLSGASIGFVLYAYFFPTALLFFILLDHLAGVVFNGRTLLSVQRSEIGWGLVVGICMFVGFWSLLQAITLSANNVSLVLLVLSLKTPFIALLAVPLFRERVTWAKFGAVILATLSLVLWEAGTYF
jgi:hypothetical protein